MFSLSFYTTAYALSVLLSTSNVAGYTLVNTFDASNFFSDFSFFTATDPTEGYVKYVSSSAATNGLESAGQALTSTANSQVYLGVDHTENNPSGGRASVRVSSNEAFTQGVFIADIAHMPVGCGTWPAFWMFGPNWPASGEIDIIEGVNVATTNTITLHTAPGCDVNNVNSLAGTKTLQENCNAGDAGTGCGVSTTNTAAFGAGLNAQGGGVYAMQWASSGVYVWFFNRNAIPADITAEKPNVASWGVPMATFNSQPIGGCDFDTSFKQHNLVFDTTFCGSWAGQQSLWSESSCGALASTCEAFVAANPAAFVDAYWLINSVKVYQ